MEHRDLQLLKKVRKEGVKSYGRAESKTNSG